MNKNWEDRIEAYLSHRMPTGERIAFEAMLDQYPERAEELRLRQLEQQAMDRFYRYTKDQPEAFPESFPGTKLYFASLFSSALFLGTFSARVFPKDATPRADTDRQLPPRPGATD